MLVGGVVKLFWGSCYLAGPLWQWYWLRGPVRIKIGVPLIPVFYSDTPCCHLLVCQRGPCYREGAPLPCSGARPPAFCGGLVS